MIAFATSEFDLNGDFSFSDRNIDPNEQSYRNITRRVSRTKTLDQGVYIIDSGYTDGDKDVKIIVIQPSEVMISKLIKIFKIHSYFTLSTIDGAYIARAESMNVVNGNAEISFYLES